MNKHFAAGFDDTNLYVVMREEGSSRLITYNKSNLREPKAVESLPTDTPAMSVLETKGILPIPNRLLRGRIGERLALYREIIEFNAISSNNLPDGYLTEFEAKSAFMHHFANERPQLARMISTIIEDINKRNENSINDTPKNSATFVRSLYSVRPDYAPTPISQASVNKSPTEYQPPQPIQNQTPSTEEELQNDTPRTKPWFYLDESGIFLSYTKVDGVGEKLILVDRNGMANQEKLAKMNFIKPNWEPNFEANIYFLNSENRSINKKDLADALNLSNCPTAQRSPKEIEETFRTQLEQQQKANRNRVLNGSLLLGTNNQGDKVYKHIADGYRWVITKNDVYLRPEIDGLHPSVGLYGYTSFTDKTPNQNEMALSLSGVISNHLNGKISTAKSSHEDFAKLLFDTNEPSKELEHQVSEVYEFALNSYLTSLYQEAMTSGDTEAEKSHFNRLVRIYNIQPVKEIKSSETINSGQYSTPVPMAFLAQKLLLGNDKPMAGYTVLEPTIGNGSLVNTITNGSVYGVEIDESRFNIIKSNPQLNVIKEDATIVDFKKALNQPDGFDYVISNPPFAPLDSAVVFDDTVQIQKLDHLIALRALEARRDSGRSVLILSSDGVYSKGKAKGSSQYLINYLASHYELVGGAEFDSALYARNGANTNVRMLIVGDRLPTPIPNDRLGEERGLTNFEILRNYEDAYAWSESMIRKYPHIKQQYENLTKPEETELEHPDSTIEIDFNGITAQNLTLGTNEETSNNSMVSEEAASTIEESPEEIGSDISIPSTSEQNVASTFSHIQAAPLHLFQDSDASNYILVDNSAVVSPIINTQEDQADNPVVVDLTLDLFSDDVTTNQTPNKRLGTETVADETDKPSLIVTGIITDLPIDNAATTATITERKAPTQVSTKNVSTKVEQNEYQATYLSRSKVGQPKSMIPINMSAATYAALDMVEEHIRNSDLKDSQERSIDNIDDWVAMRLAYPREDLGKYFSPEQVDAIALGIFNHDNGRGIINADQTGQGKGRFVAAMMRFAKIEQSIPVFATYKPELFTDIYRDIAEIGSLDLFKKPFTFNNTDIRRFDNLDQVLFPKLSGAAHKLAIQNNELPDDTDLILVTYSQLAKMSHKSPKVQFLLNIMSQNKATLFLDESHLAAGESLTGGNVREAVSYADAVIYSSATPLKQVKHYGVYSRVFPKSVDIEKLPETLQKGGEALQEAISTSMAEDGVLIRRERDFSELTFNSVEPKATHEEEIKTTANQVANVLAMMARLSNDLSAEAKSMSEDFEASYDKLPDAAKNQSGALRASSMNFGSRIYHLNRQFLLGSKIDMVAEYALECIRNNTKPVIGVESTAGALLEQMVRNKVLGPEQVAQLDTLQDQETLDDAEAEVLKNLKELLDKGSKSLVFEQPPQYKDYLRLMLDKLGTITIKNGLGKIEEVIINEEPGFLEVKEEITKQIDQLPYIPLSPLDIIRERLNENGYHIAEISGRTKSGQRHLAKVEVIDENTQKTKTVWKLKHFEKMDHSLEIGKFQNGEYDAAIVTRSGSTGYSLHATDKYENSDYRQRNFLALEKAANIAEYLQWIGRVDRTGQVVSPVITSIESGLPAERRITMMHNAKLRKLSANTTSNRDNSNMEAEVDLLNNVGDEVALRFLMQNKNLAQSLDISIPTNEGDIKAALLQSNDNQYINRLMGRLVLLEVEDQEHTIASLEERFTERLIELDAEGKNPFKVDVYDWKAEIVASEELDDYNEHTSNSSFDAPLNVVQLKFQVQHKPIPQATVDKAIQQGREKMFNRDWMEDFQSLTENKSDLKEFTTMATDVFLGRALKSLPPRIAADWFGNSPINLLSRKWRFDDPEEHEFCQSQIEKAEFLREALNTLKPGEPIIVVNQLFEPQVAIVTSIEMPKNKSGLGALSNYEVKLAIAGEEHIQTTNLATLFNGLDRNKSENQPMFIKGPDRAAILQEFEETNAVAAEKSYDKHVTVLKDNLFKAVEMAADRNFGRPILYTDTNGYRQRAVLLRAGTTIEQVVNGPIKLSPNQIQKYSESFLKQLELPNDQSSSSAYPIFTTNCKIEKNSFNLKAIITPDKVLLELTEPKKGAMRQFINDTNYFVVRGKENPLGFNLKAHGNNKLLTSTMSHENFFKMVEKMKNDKYQSNMHLQNGDKLLLEALKSNKLSMQQGQDIPVNSTMCL